MTMTASRNQNSNSPTSIRVGITYGPVSAYVDEDAGHLRSFHEQLGRLLDEGRGRAEARMTATKAIGTPITDEQATRAILRMLTTPLVGDIDKDPHVGYTLARIHGPTGCYEHLSSGEKRLVDIASSLWNHNNRDACINVLGGLDRQRRRSVLMVLAYLYLGRDLPFPEASKTEFTDMFEASI